MLDGLPPGTSGRTARVIDRALRLSQIAALADGDDGAAVTSWQSDRRRHLLQQLASSARVALMAATVRQPEID